MSRIQKDSRKDKQQLMLCSIGYCEENTENSILCVEKDSLKARSWGQYYQILLA
jgi:hypothetical protein